MLTPRKAVADSMQIMELDPSVYLAQSAAGRSELLAPSHCFHFRLARSPDAYSIIQPCLPCHYTQRVSTHIYDHRKSAAHVLARE